MWDEAKRLAWLLLHGGADLHIWRSDLLQSHRGDTHDIGNRLVGRSDRDARRCDSKLALQSELGLLAQRWTGPGGDRCHPIVVDGAHMIEGIGFGTRTCME